MYNLRTSAMSSARVNSELERFGAHTSGSLQRRQQRLQRFRDAAAQAPPPTKRMKLESQLEERGAATFGSTQRLQERLARFLEAESRELNEIAQILMSLHTSPMHSYNLRSRKTNTPSSQ